MKRRSLVKTFLFTLGLVVVVPSNDKYEEIKTYLDDIPLSKLGSIMLNHRNKGYWDRNKLVKKLFKDDFGLSFDQSETNIWKRLQYCGSGITKSMFVSSNENNYQGNENNNNNIIMEGTYLSTYKILHGNTYSKNFLKRFKYLWKRDEALRRLEWKLLKIGRLHDRDYLIQNLSKSTVNVLLNHDNNLIDIIRILSRGGYSNNNNVNNKLIRSIGKSLIYKYNSDDDYYELFVKWLDLDPIHCPVILATSLERSGKYNNKELIEKFTNRIKSDKKLTRKLKII